jgi:hypothetical protein
MASIEFEGKVIRFEDGECLCDAPDLQTFGQALIDGIPGYFPERENSAAEALAGMGGSNLVLDDEKTEESDLINWVLQVH